MEPNSRLAIDLDAIAHNARAIRARLPAGCVLCGVVKGDAYGFGARTISRTLAGAGVAMLAVYALDEAAEVLAAGVDRPVLLLGPRVEAPDGPMIERGAAEGRLQVTATSPGSLEAVARLGGRVGRPIPVHIEVDTGMVRAGCSERDTPRLVADVLADRRTVLAGVFTHMADADDDAGVDEQAGRFRAVLDALPPLPPSCRLHLANTRTVYRRPDLTADMVRCGQGWAGFGDPGASTPAAAGEAGLRRAATWTSRLVHVRAIRAGATVGYGRTWRAERPSRIGLVPVGYADGFPRPLGGDGHRRVFRLGLGRGADGRPQAWVPVVGAVSMDQLTVDLTDVPPGVPVGPGAEIELIGPDPAAPNDAAALAAAAGTTVHEILSRLGPRVRRCPTLAGAGTGVGVGAGVGAGVGRGPGVRPRTRPA